MTEKDPNNLNPHELGAKLDAHKVRLDLVLRGFSKALIQVGHVGTMGAKKYSDNGWKSVPNGYNRYGDALLRHYFSNHVYDAESSLLHDAHVAWNALARLQLKLEELDNYEA